MDFKFKQGCIEGIMGYIPVYFLCKKSNHITVNNFVYMFTVCLLLYTYLFTCLQNVYNCILKCLQVYNYVCMAMYQHVYVIVIIVYEKCIQCVNVYKKCLQ